MDRALPIPGTAQTQEQTPASAPRFVAGRPWHVRSIRRDGAKIIVEISDSNGATGLLEFPAEQLKLIQTIGDYTDTKKKLYAEIRQAPRRLFFQPPHAIVYLGEVDKGELATLEQELTQRGIDM